MLTPLQVIHQMRYRSLAARYNKLNSYRAGLEYEDWPEEHDRLTHEIHHVKELMHITARRLEGVK